MPQFLSFSVVFFLKTCVSHALDGSVMALTRLLAVLMASFWHGLEACCRTFQDDAELRSAVRRWEQWTYETWQGWMRSGFHSEEI